MSVKNEPENQKKNKTAVNFVKLKANQKTAVFCKTEPKSYFCRLHTPNLHVGVVR